MGSDSKHSKSHRSKKRKHEDVSDPSSDGGSSSDSSEGSSDRERTKHKKHHKEKKKHKHHKKKSSKEKKMLKEAKAFLKSKLKEHGSEKKRGADKKKPVKMIPVPMDFQITQISTDHYFLKNTEFSKWLNDQKGLLFNEMTSEETHALFGEFVEAWNGRLLSEEYYKGGLGEVARTSHNWGFKAATSAADREERDREERLAAMAELKQGRKDWRAEQRLALDELLPKATGREAMIEKKAVRREQARERDVSPEMNRLIGGGDVMGGDDSFAAAKAREQQRQQWRQQRQSVRDEERNQKAAAARANEDARMAAFRDLVKGGPISIPKRN